MTAIASCPHCAMRVIPSADGRCPACGKGVGDAVAKPVPPPPPPPSHPVVASICVIVSAIGIARYLMREQQQYDAIIVDLLLIWIGAIGLCALSAKRLVDRRRGAPPGGGAP